MHSSPFLPHFGIRMWVVLLAPMVSVVLLTCHLLLDSLSSPPPSPTCSSPPVAHLSPAQINHHHYLLFLRHPLLGLLPVLAALPLPFLPIAPTSRVLPLLLIPPLILLLVLPFLPPSHLPLLRTLFLSLPLLLLARTAGFLAAAFPVSDLQAHALSVTAILLVLATTASFLSALSLPKTAHHFLAETALAFAGVVGGLWALQSVLSLYVDSCAPAGCHRLMQAPLAPATRCDIEESRLRAVAIMDLVLSVHCVAVATATAGLYLGLARWCRGDGGGGGADVGTKTGRRHNDVGGSYDALPTVASSGATAEMEHLQMKAVVGKSVAQE